MKKLFLILLFSLSVVAGIEAQTGGVTAQAPSAAAQDVRPVPDPTALTTQQLNQAIAALREIIQARLDGYDKVIIALQKDLDQRAADIDFRVGHLKEVADEKFRSVGTQFAERDTRTEQISKQSEVAINAALQAAKEAVGEQNKSSALAIAKSEAATTKQIDQIGALITLTTGGFNDKIEDLKSRLASIDGHAQGSGDVWGFVVGGIGALVALATLIIMSRKHPEK